MILPHNKDVATVRNELHTAWTGIRAAVEQMYPSSQMRPANATDIFRSVNDPSGQPRFEAGPVVFCVPERANSPVANLYVVLSGWISFSPPRDTDPRRTTLSFSTSVGYFRAKGAEIVHVYGVHYDMDERLPGHPVFHAQISSQAELASAITDQFRGITEQGNDSAAGLLKTVRTPTAQMDLFSVITQIGADHLVSEKSPPEVLSAFGKLRAACDFFVGAGGHIDYLNCESAAMCYRSTHWYERDDPVVEA